MAKGAMIDRDKVMKNRGIRLPTKVRLVRSLVFSIFLYGAETWTMKSRDHSTINAFEMWCWRRLLRIPWIAHRTNQSILEELNIKDRLSTVCMRRVLRFFGHVVRRGADSLERLLVTGCVEGTRPRGRIPARWSDQARVAAGGTLHEAMRRAEDRSAWRKLVQEYNGDGHDPQH